MSWDKSDNGDTSRMCYYWILEEVENHLKKVIYSKEDRWFNIIDYDVRSRKRDYDKSVYRLIHDILFHFDNHDEDGQRIDESREWNCFYEYFLGVDQYDDLESDVDNEKFWWVSKEDENYSKMNKFLEDLYKESIVYVNELLKRLD